MKQYCLLLLFVTQIATSSLFGQQTINETFMHDGIPRDYILYVPSLYTGSVPVPVLFNFHGYTSNANDQMWYGDFRDIADTANFIIVHPEGTIDGSGQTHFNVGWGGSSVDDVSMTSSLLDTLASQYNLDLDRVYSTGMSNGGFMSFRLACELSDRIAAIASVTGSILPTTLDNCNPTHPTPIMQIHGDSDGTVPYTGGVGWSEPIVPLVNWWSDYNNCNQSPITITMPDISVTDGSTVEKYTYTSGDSCTEVVHYKVLGGDHTWPGTAFNFAGTNYDIDASVEIWNFVSQYDINGRISCPQTNLLYEEEMVTLNIFPNPTQDLIHVQGVKERTRFEISTLVGTSVAEGFVDADLIPINVSELPANYYLLKIEGMIIPILKMD